MFTLCKPSNQRTSNLAMSLTTCLLNPQSMKTMKSQGKSAPEEVSLDGKDALKLLPQKLREKLMPFQREGVCFALSRNGRQVYLSLCLLSFCYVTFCSGFVFTPK